jgi:hypothetical protein
VEKEGPGNSRGAATLSNLAYRGKDRSRGLDCTRCGCAVRMAIWTIRIMGLAVRMMGLGDP